jgi:predicted transcriptional regulator
MGKKPPRKSGYDRRSSSSPVSDIEKRYFGVYRLNDEERAAVPRGLREMREGKLASDEEVAAVFARYRA